MLTQKSALIDKMAQSPSFISMCQFGDICLKGDQNFIQGVKGFSRLQ